MHDRRLELMRDLDRLGQVEHDLGDIHQGRAALPTHVFYQSRQVAPRDVLILQARGIGAQVSVQESHDSGVLPLAHHPIQDRGFVP
jgi:hypothetical protein